MRSRIPAWSQSVIHRLLIIEKENTLSEETEQLLAQAITMSIADAGQRLTRGGCGVRDRHPEPDKMKEKKACILQERLVTDRRHCWD